MFYCLRVLGHTAFMALAMFAKAMVIHDVTSRTNRNAIFGKREIALVRAVSFVSRIKIDESGDILMMSQPVDSISIVS